jgi:hypothetical protein
MKTTRRMVEAAKTMGWKDFVCHYVATATAKKPVRGHAVRRAGNLWELTFNGVADMAPMTAEVAYSWFERLPLLALSREADDVRYDAKMAA